MWRGALRCARRDGTESCVRRTGWSGVGSRDRARPLPTVADGLSLLAIVRPHPLETSPSRSCRGRSLVLSLVCWLLVCWLLVGWLLLAGCSPAADEGDGPPLQRLALRVAAGDSDGDNDSPWPRAEVVASLDLSPFFEALRVQPGDDSGEGPWQVSAPDHHGGYLPGRQGEAAARVLWLLNPDGAQGMRISFLGEFEAGAFNQVRLRLLVGGSGDAGAELRRDGRVVGYGMRQQMVQSPGLRDVVLPIPERFTDGGGADTLSISFSKTARRIAVAGVELLRLPAEAWLPDPAQGPVLVRIGGDARRGVGVSTRRAVACSVTVPREGRLSFSYGQPLEVVRLGSDLELVLTIDSTEGSIAERFAFSKRRVEWRTAEIDLSSLAGSEARIAFSLEAGDGQPAVAAVAELALWVPRRRPPSLLLITSDTHRFDHVGAAQPDSAVSTPVLDALAARGVFFERCFSTTNVTNPSHGSMLTGVHPRDTAILHNNLPLNGSALTLAEVLADQGWQTQAVLGVRHLGHPSSGLGQGFDRIDWPDAGERDVEASLTIVEQWLRQAEERPLFLWLHLFDAHGPYKPDPVFRRLYWPDDANPFDPALPAPAVPDWVLPETLTGLRDLSWPLAAYRAEVSGLDSSLAGLLNAPRFAEGVVAVTADHGESFGQHGIWFGHAGLYPDSTHVPLILSWPGAPRGRRVAASVSLVDLGATLLELSGVAGHDLPGRSFAALAAAGSGAAGTANESPCFALSAHRFSASVTNGRWHLILHLNPQQQRNMTTSFAHHQIELYDLDSDPGCEHDLSVDRFAEAARLRGRLIAWLEAARDMGWMGEELDDPERLEQLRQLGYLAASAPTSSELWAADDCDRCAPFAADDH